MTSGLALLAMAAVTVFWTYVWHRVSVSSGYDLPLFLLALTLTVITFYTGLHV